MGKNTFVGLDIFYQTAFQNDYHEEGKQEQSHTDGGGVKRYNYCEKQTVFTKAEHIYPIPQQSEYLFFFRKAVLDTGKNTRGSAGVLITLFIDHSASHRFNL